MQEAPRLSSHQLLQCVHDIFTSTQEVFEQGSYIGEPKTFFALVEEGRDLLPVSMSVW